MEVDRYAAGVEYFGKNYKGWQIQKSTNETVQAKVEEALTKASWNPNMNPPKITINMAKIGKSVLKIFFPKLLL